MSRHNVWLPNLVEKKLDQAHRLGWIGSLSGLVREAIEARIAEHGDVDEQERRVDEQIKRLQERKAIYAHMRTERERDDVALASFRTAFNDHLRIARNTTREHKLTWLEGHRAEMPECFKDLSPAEILSKLEGV